ncbi:MAG: SCO family protein [Alphaproteobacteria bacterium]|nr:SCO family protein [Alphaproteobacteria bacterium]
MRTVRIIALTAVSVLIALALVARLGVWDAMFPSPPPSYGAVMVKPFTLVDQRGQKVTEHDMLGRPAVVFFGFTYCPEVCPTTLADITSWIGELGPEANRLGFYFVTVDPGRDTPEELNKYLSSFDPRIRGLTGTAADIDAVAKAFGIYYKRIEIEGGGYTMDHTSSILLLDASGRFAGTITYQEAKDVAVAKLKRLAEQGAPAA